MLLPSLLRGPVEAGTSSKDGDQSRPQLPGGGLVAAGRGKGGGSGRGHSVIQYWKGCPVEEEVNLSFVAQRGTDISPRKRRVF